MKTGYSLSEAHVYVGCNPYPELKGKTTVAPGQYTYNASSLDHVTGMTVNFTDVTGDVYIIAHAVTCEIECSCSGKDYSGNGGTPETVNLGINCTKDLDSKRKISFIEDYGVTPIRVYPNPFGSKTTFEFTSAQDARAVLEVHNILGQKVITLMDRIVKEGVVNRIEYQPLDQLGGIYTYRLMLNNTIQTGKIVYTKND